MRTNYSSTKLKPVIRDYGCKYRMPHDLTTTHEDKNIIVQVCGICNKKKRYKKHFKGRVDNRAYLEDHARNFAQPRGRTKRLYMKIHYPEKCIIQL